MAIVIPNPESIRSFRTQAALEKWLSKHHDTEPELWLKIHKKESGLPTVTAAEALEVALCWGWIDGIRKGYDDSSFLQRYSPRKARSTWSQINREHVARLVAAGRMTPHGQKHVDAAKADGRWDAAYAPMRNASIASLPEDLRKAIAASPRASKALLRLERVELFALAHRMSTVKTASGRTKKISGLVSKLERGERIGQQRKS
ncbi:MAG: YdeI/OmpD-associated family protein [Polyangiaceae bacterium]